MNEPAKNKIKRQNAYQMFRPAFLVVYNPVRRANARQRYQTKQKMLKANPAKIINRIPPVMTK